MIQPAIWASAASAAQRLDSDGKRKQLIGVRKQAASTVSPKLQHCKKPDSPASPRPDKKETKTMTQLTHDEAQAEFERNKTEFERNKTDYVSLRNKTTGEIKKLKIGWSWTCLFWSGLLGIPLFVRGLNVWGAIMVAIWAVNWFISDTAGTSVLALVGIGLAVFFAIKANAMAGKQYLERGWEFASPNANVARRAWGLPPI
jgi:hypothetical protein